MKEQSVFERAKKIKEDWESIWKKRIMENEFNPGKARQLARRIRRERKTDERRYSISHAINPNEFTLEEAQFLGFKKQKDGLMLLPIWLCPFLNNGIELVSYYDSNPIVIFKFSELEYLPGCLHLSLGCYLKNKDANKHNY